MPRGEAGAEQPSQQEVSKKHFGKENILAASDKGELLEAYRRAAEQRTSYTRMSDLQVAVADRFHQLGDEDNSLQFTFLAGQTRNTEDMNSFITNFDEVRSRLHIDMTVFQEGADSFKNMGRGINDAAEKILSGSTGISRATDRMQEAAATIDRASSRMRS